MIDISIPAVEKDEYFQEGILGDSIKAASGVDVNQVQTDLANAGTTSEKIGVMKGAVKVGSKGIADNIEKTNKSLDNYRVSGKSIVARARQSILQFPIYVTRSIRDNEAHIIAKTFERVYATLVQTVLSHNSTINEEEANNLVFLKQFHTNIRESAETLINKYYEAIDDFDQIMCESIFHTEQITPNLLVEFRVVPTLDTNLILENSRLTNEPLSGFMYLQEAEIKDTRVEKEEDNSGSTPERILSNEALERIAQSSNVGVDRLKELIKRSHNGKEFGDERIYYKREIDKNGNAQDIYFIPRFDHKKSVETRPLEAVRAPIMLKDSEIKKINGMLPYTFEASFRLKGKDDKYAGDVKYVIGVKSVLHPILVKDLSEDLREIITGNEKTLQKVRYTTGEISFKDYYFNIKGLKSDAAKHINYNKRWLNTLKRLGEYEKMNGSLLKDGITAITGGHIPVPNGTLILAQPDVTKLTNETGIDLSVVSNAKRLARTLFLIGVVIIDSTAGTMRVLFPDSDNDWDIQSLSSIDAEVSKTDNSQLMRELNRMVHK